MKQASVLVCGTGIAGLACALGLSRAGLSVDLLGPRQMPPVRPADDYHPRVYAISDTSRALLDRLGAWRLIHAHRITPVEAMEIHGDANGFLDLSAWQDARDTLAWIVESGEIERALQQAVQVMGVAWHEDQFTGLETKGQGVCVMTASGRCWQPDLLIGADGARSPVRQAAQIHHDYTPYGDMGVVAHLDIERPHQNRACQWFTGDSVFALLPLPDTADGPQASLVWSMPENRARRWLAMDAEAQQAYLFAHALAITGGRLGRLRLRTRPQGFPLTLERTAMVAPGVALVGDAAHRVHPLAGQGLNLGLGDVQTLIQVLSDREPHRAIGDLQVLARYRRRRAEPVWAMGAVTHGLHRLFGTQCASLAWARNQGMQLADRLPFLKRQLIRAAAGD
ncbi:FAD-dependent monooxygenase [Castellaniella sp.]|uniref:FAD-dependent monooxygenase n=1 Tax=Castellaniella sp. TaxID=1955812 RepID=UPI002B002F0E|nr:FAD-dependent monooxygenase [Castellaniella sp.]